MWCPLFKGKQSRDWGSTVESSSQGIFGQEQVLYCVKRGKKETGCVHCKPWKLFSSSFWESKRLTRFVGKAFTSKGHLLQRWQSGTNTLIATQPHGEPVCSPQWGSYVLGILGDSNNWPLGPLVFLFSPFKSPLFCFKFTSKEGALAPSPRLQ